MKEIQEIVQAYELARKEGKQTALATVVQVQGSSYRQPGARMLITEDGELTGAISGGCLEGDALRKAQLVMFQQKPKLVAYDTMDDDDAQLGVGLGCNGIIHVLIEPIAPQDTRNPIQLLQHFLHKRQSGVLITLFSFEKAKAQQAGTCLLLSGEGKQHGSCPDKVLQQALVADAEEALQKNTSTIKSYPDGLSGYIEVLQPAVSLVIAGAGNDVIPLTQLAAVMGWETSIVDGRAQYATKARFPTAKNIVVATPEDALGHLTTDERSVFVLMTHNYNYDLALLKKLLPLGLPYIGSLGPKRKLERMLNELAEEGIPLSKEQQNSLYGPVGLDIGAESPEEIALSIVSEIKAVLSGKKGSPLREKREPIHTAEAEATGKAAADLTKSDQFQREVKTYSSCQL